MAKIYKYSVVTKPLKKHRFSYDAEIEVSDTKDAEIKYELDASLPYSEPDKEYDVTLASDYEEKNPLEEEDIIIVESSNRTNSLHTNSIDMTFSESIVTSEEVTAESKYNHQDTTTNNPDEDVSCNSDTENITKKKSKKRKKKDLKKQRKTKLKKLNFAIYEENEEYIALQEKEAHLEELLNTDGYYDEILPIDHGSKISEKIDRNYKMLIPAIGLLVFGIVLLIYQIL